MSVHNIAPNRIRIRETRHLDSPLQFIVDGVAKVLQMQDTGEAHAYMEANTAPDNVVDES